MLRSMIVLCFIILITASAFSQEQIKLLASDGEAGDEFGIFVAGDEGYVAIGAHKEDEMGTDAGAVYLFEWDGQNWNEQQKLTASTPGTFDWFGESGKLYYPWLIVGATGDDDLGTNSGAAYVMRHDGLSWIEEAKLTADDGAGIDLFGTSVWICESPNVAIVGSPMDDDAGNASGSAYIFRNDGQGWFQEAKLTASDAASDDQFGFSVTIDGDYAIVGAPKADGGEGAVYVYKFDGITWIEQGKLIVNDVQKVRESGHSTALLNNVATIGAPFDDAEADEAGAAYVFRRNGEVWTQEAKLVAPDAAANDWFGSSVDIEDETVAVGAWGNDLNGSVSGAAYEYEFDGQDWVYVSSTYGDAGEQRGFDVELFKVQDLKGIISSAVGNDDNGIDAGAAFLGWDGAIGETVTAFAIDHTSIGEADLEVLPNEYSWALEEILVVSHLSSSGLDGVWMDLGFPSSGWGARVEGLFDVAPAYPRGVEWRMIGEVDGIPDQDLLTVSVLMEEEGAYYHATSEMSGTDQFLVEFYSENILVMSILVAEGDPLFSHSDGPILEYHEFEMSFTDDQIMYEINFDEEVVLTVNGTPTPATKVISFMTFTSAKPATMSCEFISYDEQEVSFVGEKVQMFGNWHQGLGEAKFFFDEYTTFRLVDVATSGEDGTRIDVDENGLHIMIDWTARTYDLTGWTMTQTDLGGHEVGCIVMEGNSNLIVDVSAIEADGVLVETFDQGVLVDSRTVPGGLIGNFSNFSLDNLMTGITAEYVPIWGLIMNESDVFSFVNLETVTGDEFRFTPTNPQITTELDGYVDVTFSDPSGEGVVILDEQDWILPSIPCGDIDRFQARCRPGGLMQMRVIMKYEHSYRANG